MKPIVISDLFAVSRRLAELGIEFSALVEALRAGCIARQSCTDLDPRMFPGSTMWAHTVRQLRLGLIPLGWDFSEAGNFSRTISPDKSRVIVVATGDEATGLPEQMPTTQSRKGPRTIEVVATNAGQLSLDFKWPEDIPQSAETKEGTTWLLLVHFAGDKVRGELARPVCVDDALRVSGWHERIILPVAEAEPEEMFDFGSDDSPDIDVEVRRRR